MDQGLTMVEEYCLDPENKKRLDREYARLTRRIEERRKKREAKAALLLPKPKD
jgi:hypothetical protein